jgi:hypothetical protein
MADKKVTALDALSSPLVTDLVYGVSDPGGTPVSKKVAISDILALAPPPPTQTAGTFLVSGGAVIWITGLQFTVTAANYYIQGIRYSSAQQDITLTAADGTNPRIDVIGLDSAGLVFKVTGVAAASPGEPNIDPTTQIQLAFVTIAANASTPTGVANEVIYTDAAGAAAEWNFTASGTGFTVDSTSSPIAGTKSILCAAPTNASYAQGARGSGSVEVNNYDYLVFKIKNTSTWAGNRSLLIEFLVSGVLKGSAIQLINGAFGFSGSSTATQIIAIPAVLFGVPIGTLINQIRFIDNGGSINFRMDDISLHLSGSGQPAIQNGLTQAQADARYIRLANVVNGDLVNVTALPSVSIPTLTFSVGVVSAIANVSASGTVTLTTASKTYQVIDGNGANRTVLLPAEAAGLTYNIKNVSDTEVITVKEDSNTTTLATLAAGEFATFVCDTVPTWQVY